MHDKRLVDGKDRGEAGMPSVTFSLPAGHRMDNDEDHRKNGIHWTPWSQLKDLDFVDDLTLLSHSGQQMQEKTEFQG